MSFDSPERGSNIFSRGLQRLGKLSVSVIVASALLIGLLICVGPVLASPTFLAQTNNQVKLPSGGGGAPILPPLPGLGAPVSPIEFAQKYPFPNAPIPLLQTERTIAQFNESNEVQWFQTSGDTSLHDPKNTYLGQQEYLASTNLQQWGHQNPQITDWQHPTSQDQVALKQAAENAAFSQKLLVQEIESPSADINLTQVLHLTSWNAKMLTKAVESLDSTKNPNYAIDLVKLTFPHLWLKADGTDQDAFDIYKKAFEDRYDMSYDLFVRQLEQLKEQIDKSQTLVFEGSRNQYNHIDSVADSLTNLASKASSAFVGLTAKDIKKLKQIVLELRLDKSVIEKSLPLIEQKTTAPDPSTQMKNLVNDFKNGETGNAVSIIKDQANFFVAALGDLGQKLQKKIGVMAQKKASLQDMVTGTLTAIRKQFPSSSVDHVQPSWLLGHTIFSAISPNAPVEAQPGSTQHSEYVSWAYDLLHTLAPQPLAVGFNYMKDTPEHDIQHQIAPQIDKIRGILESVQELTGISTFEYSGTSKTQLNQQDYDITASLLGNGQVLLHVLNSKTHWASTTNIDDQRWDIGILLPSDYEIHRSLLGLSNPFHLVYVASIQTDAHVSLTNTKTGKPIVVPTRFNFMGDYDIASSIGASSNPTEQINNTDATFNGSLSYMFLPSYSLTPSLNASTALFEPKINAALINSLGLFAPLTDKQLNHFFKETIEKKLGQPQAESIIREQISQLTKGLWHWVSSTIKGLRKQFITGKQLRLNVFLQQKVAGQQFGVVIPHIYGHFTRQLDANNVDGKQNYTITYQNDLDLLGATADNGQALDGISFVNSHIHLFDFDIGALTKAGLDYLTGDITDYQGFGFDYHQKYAIQDSTEHPFHLDTSVVLPRQTFKIMARTLDAQKQPFKARGDLPSYRDLETGKIKSSL